MMKMVCLLEFLSAVAAAVPPIPTKALLTHIVASADVKIIEVALLVVK